MTSNKPVRVLIVEDHQIVADGQTALLNGQKDMTVVGNVGSVAESAATAAELRPDIVLLDFRLNDGTGADAAAAIRRVAPNAKHIFLTREDSDVARYAALESGASGFIHKSRAAAEVVDAIRKVAAGGTLITPSAIATLINRRRQMDSQRESLTAREKEVLRLMAEGVSSRDIASKLGISYATVRTHIRSLDAKLGVHSKVQAIVKARELALID
jgi:DNA-binding NarL/FixJ family response regulator